MSNEAKPLNSKMSFDEFKLNSDGMLTVVVQDHKTNEVLMVAYMTKEAYEYVQKLEDDLIGAKDITSAPEYAMYCKDTILPDMAALRISVDSAEAIASKEDWPYPSYGELLFGVR